MGKFHSYEFVPGPDDLWTAEAVPTGTYTLEAMVGDEGAADGPPSILAYGRMSVTIPADPPSGRFDAGELVLRRVTPSVTPAGSR